METIFKQYFIPISIIGTYLSILLIHRYIKINKKFYLLIAMTIGMTINIFYTSFGMSNIIEVLISGSLSGLIAYSSYNTINKYIFGRNMRHEKK